MTAAQAGLQNTSTRYPKGMQQAQGDAGLASGYFSRRLISSSCQLKQGWQPVRWRLQHGRAWESGDEKVNKHGCHPGARCRLLPLGSMQPSCPQGDRVLEAKANTSHATGWRWGHFKEMFRLLQLNQGWKFPDQHSPTAAGASPVRYHIPLCFGETEARGDTLLLRPSA